MSDRQEFHYNQGVAPMMWVLFALSLLELVTVHFFIAYTWPHIGWPLTIVSAFGAVWILLWIRSFKTRPHCLDNDVLVLNFGRLRSVRIEIANIAKVTASFEPGALDQKGIINLAGIAHPNRGIELIAPLPRDRCRIFIRVDQPEDFDRALKARHVPFA
jgi:hypothetical protein